MTERVTAVLVAAIVGAAFGQARARSLLTLYFGIATTTYLGLVLVGKVEPKPLWLVMTGQVEKFLATDLWPAAVVGLVVGFGLSQSGDTTVPVSLAKRVARSWQGGSAVSSR